MRYITFVTTSEWQEIGYTVVLLQHLAFYVVSMLPQILHLKKTTYAIGSSPSTLSESKQYAAQTVQGCDVNTTRTDYTHNHNETK